MLPSHIIKFILIWLVLQMWLHLSCGISIPKLMNLYIIYLISQWAEQAEAETDLREHRGMATRGCPIWEPSLCWWSRYLVCEDQYDAGLCLAHCMQLPRFGGNQSVFLTQVQQCLWFTIHDTNHNSPISVRFTWCSIGKCYSLWTTCDTSFILHRHFQHVNLGLLFAFLEKLVKLLHNLKIVKWIYESNVQLY